MEMYEFEKELKRKWYTKYPNTSLKFIESYFNRQMEYRYELVLECTMYGYTYKKNFDLTECEEYSVDTVSFYYNCLEIAYNKLFKHRTATYFVYALGD